ncbi:UNVERIFIED_CONTAM: hypothetical protein Slati_4269800 [Sesamum latifolium]|uniref:Uncharacterized protein n=1 Tax=Sesamum latifolium TaxID=2727402 RepID=A0AAW2TCD9_9LAMI
MAIEGKWLLTRPRSWKDSPQRPKSDKFYRFHNDYDHTTEEYRYLKNEIERLIQNGHLQEYVCCEKSTGTGPYQRQEGDKVKETKVASPERFPKEGTKYALGSKGEISDPSFPPPPPRKGVIRMIVGGPVGGDSHHARKVADILFGEAYDQMQLGDIFLEKVNTSLYGFAGEVVHPRGMVSLPVMLGAGVARRTCMLKFLVVDVPYAYNVILGRPTLNAFQVVVSTYHMKIKFSTPSGVGEVQDDPLQSRKCYVEAVHKGQKRTSDETHKEVSPSKMGKDICTGEVPEGTRTPVKVKPAEELLNIEIIPGHPDKTTRIGSQMSEETKKEVVRCLQRNADIFAWTPQDLEGIDPKVMTHYLNIDASIKPVKQKKRYFGSEKDKIIQAEVDKLMAARHIEEIQFPEWLSNVVLVPKPGKKWRMCIDFRDLNKACPKDFYPLPRIDQLVDSTSGCELLSMMDTLQGYHPIMLVLEDRKS